MLRPRLKNFRGALAVALLFAGVSLSTAVFAGFKPNTTLEPTEDLSDTDDSVASTPAPVVPTAEPANYSGRIRRYPVSGSPQIVYGDLSLAVTALGKVTGTIKWYDPDEKATITGKQDLNTKQGSFVIRDANGNRVPGATRLLFRISGKGKLVGGGITDGGETASFKLFKQSDASSSGYGTEGGGTLTLGGANSYSGSSSVVNTGTLTTVTGSVGSVNTISGGTVLTGINTVVIGTGTVLTGNPTIIINGGGTTPAIVNGNLTYGSAVLLYGPFTTAAQADGSTVYTGTNSIGTASTVTVAAGTVVSGG